MKDKKKMTYSEQLHIDPYNLKGEWVFQPELYDIWAKAWANAQYKVDKVKSKRKRVKAEITTRVNMDPAIHGWADSHKAPTGVFIDSVIRMDEGFKEVDKKYNKAMWEANRMDAAKTAFLHRRKALEYLSSLYITSNYSVPTVESALEKEIRDEQIDYLQKYQKP